MKRIGFIAPVEFMSGNLSGTQELTYRPDNNPAWGAPTSKRSYANNYKARYVGIKRSSDGRVYFGVRTKNAVNMTPKARESMALLSVSSVMANLIGGDLSTLSQLTQYFKLSGYPEQGWTFKRWIMTFVRGGLSGKSHIYFNSPGQSSIIYVNPYISAAPPSGAHTLEAFPQELLAKFWMELANNPMLFYVEGKRGIARTGMTFGDLINNTSLNILGIIPKNSGANPYTGIGDNFLLTPASEYVLQTDAIVAETKYTLTPVTPA